MTAPRIEYVEWESKPRYIPAHASPVWLSSAEVITAIRELALAGADKAFCWDMYEKVLGMERKSHTMRLPPDTAHE